jgi:hypothetical protein
MTPVRAGAALAMLFSASALYGLAATSAFGFANLEIEGTTITPDATIRDRLALVEGENIFEIATEPLEARLRAIPAIAVAEISLGLPGTVAVRIEERKPIVVWRIGERRLLADDGGLLFAGLDDTSRNLSVGQTLDSVDFDAARRLASLTPGAVGSSATALSVGITDENGFVLSSVPKSWVAVFGFYGRSLRTPDLVPGQAQLLQKLLLGREPTVALVILADDRDGTYIPKPSPRPSATPKP